MSLPQPNTSTSNESKTAQQKNSLKRKEAPSVDPPVLAATAPQQPLLAPPPTKMQRCAGGQCSMRMVNWPIYFKTGYSLHGLECIGKCGIVLGDSTTLADVGGGVWHCQQAEMNKGRTCNKMICFKCQASKTGRTRRGCHHWIALPPSIHACHTIGLCVNAIWSWCTLHVILLNLTAYI